MQRWKARFHAYEVVTLPAKLAQWGRSLQPGALGASSTPGQVQTVVNRLWGLNFDRNTLITFAAEIGSDVPFFFEGPLKT